MSSPGWEFCIQAAQWIQMDKRQIYFKLNRLRGFRNP
jgi:hypothetical protein